MPKESIPTERFTKERFKRENTRKIKVGGVFIGGNTPITVQSMCNTKTRDVEATLEQIARLIDAGCDIVRLAVPDRAAANALPEIRRRVSLPLVADIHFDYKLALAAVDAGFDKIRINPGNIGSPERVREVANACKSAGAAIRIGVNSGSVEKKLLEKYGPTPRALVESALGHIHMLEDFGFGDICVSVKSSSVADTVSAYRLLAEKTDYPLHLGVTEAGGAYTGLIKSAAGIGALLLDGLGSTIRVSLTADPTQEVKAGIDLLRAVGLRRVGAEIISCPGCGRTDINLYKTLERVEELLKDIKTPVTVAVMGCAVNGPGEASAADYGMAGASGEGVLFRKGEIVGRRAEEALPEALAEMIKRDIN